MNGKYDDAKYASCIVKKDRIVICLIVWFIGFLLVHLHLRIDIILQKFNENRKNMFRWMPCNQNYIVRFVISSHSTRPERTIQKWVREKKWQRQIEIEKYYISARATQEIDLFNVHHCISASASISHTSNTHVWKFWSSIFLVPIS